jgi:NitT/TauT family transport system substrate-binding protein
LILTASRFHYTQRLNLQAHTTMKLSCLEGDWRPRLLAMLVLLALPARPVLAETTIRVGYIPVLGSSALFVLDGEDWAKQAGLSLKLTRFQAGTQAIQALAAGQIDAYVAGVLPLLVARAHGIDVKVVAAGAVEELELATRGTLATVAAPGASLSDRFAAFTKATGSKPRIATQPVGSVPDTLLRYWMKNQHVDPAAADIVGIDIDAAQQALLAGSVDGAILREPALTVVRHRLPTAQLLARGHALMPDQPGSVLAITHPDAPDRAAWKNTLVALFVRATTLIQSKPHEAAPFILKALGNGILSQDVIEEALASPDTKFVSDPSRLIAPVKALQDFEVSNGTLRSAIPVESLFDLGPYGHLHQ